MLAVETELVTKTRGVGGHQIGALNPLHFLSRGCLHIGVGAILALEQQRWSDRLLQLVGHHDLYTYSVRPWCICWSPDQGHSVDLGILKAYAYGRALVVFTTQKAGLGLGCHCS